jgi:3-deoxy-7-phosphoheptulonate synthase
MIKSVIIYIFSIPGILKDMNNKIRQSLKDINIRSIEPLMTPNELMQACALPDAAMKTVQDSRDAITNILSGQDSRTLLLVGPCSIHDPAAALAYAERLLALKDAVKDKFFIVMRVYFEKPRTTVGWKGFINDPDINGQCDMPKGLRLARELLIALNAMGVPAGTEFLDPITPSYIADLVSWASIGARTTESQTHREMASGLSMPVGFKNGTDGNLDVAVAAMQSVSHGHSFLGLNESGQASVYRTNGNVWGHLVLRGGKHSPNYSSDDVTAAVDQLNQAGLYNRLVIDCSHANSEKQAKRQIDVFENVIEQVAAGNQHILGAMLESHLNEGNQSSEQPVSQFKPGVSITDACLGWEDTERIIRAAFERV